jgi:hypothetical protein
MSVMIVVVTCELRTQTVPEHLSSTRFLVGFVLLPEGCRYIEELEDTKGVPRIRNSKDKQQNG